MDTLFTIVVLLASLTGIAGLLAIHQLSRQTGTRCRQTTFNMED